MRDETNDYEIEDIQKEATIEYFNISYKGIKYQVQITTEPLFESHPQIQAWNCHIDEFGDQHDDFDEEVCEGSELMAKLQESFTKMVKK